MGFRAWHHSSLAVADLDAAIRFYTEAFGYRVLFREDGMSGQIQSIAGEPDLVCDLAQLGADGTSHVLELIAFRNADGSYLQADDKPFRPGMAHVAFVADDLDATMARVEALGAVRLGAVTMFEEGRCAYYREPSGSFFELEESLRPV